MSPARRNSMQIFTNRGCFASVRRGFSALATPSAVYDVIVVKDATADYSEEFMHAALITNLPNYASAIVSTQVSGSRPVRPPATVLAPEARRQSCPPKETKNNV
jgi:hypothetical protein